MVRIEAIRRRPENFGAFVEEVSEGLCTLYGEAAAEDYRQKAPVAINASITHPAVRAWIAADPEEEGHARAMLVSAVREGMGHITFLHVLEPFAGQGLEARLVESSVAQLRADRVSGIAAEPVALCPLDLAETFARLGFSRVERQLMVAPLYGGPLESSILLDSVSAEPKDYNRVAEIIVEAYANHPGRELHAEVRTRASAETFVRTAADGAYGPTRPGFMRVLRRAGRVVAAVVGCEAAPGVGFVLQIVVRPEAQAGGLGTLLLMELAQVYREAGLSSIALGVTTNNPALRLYERLGFRKKIPVDAFVWWR
ncbi:MAG TPA: GNAT family N-acetyltransferase [Candidatus Hydrogenedentes bacterium]|nr:GNAT family N-acetyltransferase [Candidatus Hydrogenedentota bacterium]HRK33077.1 GNAT family N-acetyltransferase [Candidatus Hydrogenedentota bacterium]